MHRSFLTLTSLQVELAQKPSAYEKARLCTSYAKIIGQELIGTLLLAPYGRLELLRFSLYSQQVS